MITPNIHVQLEGRLRLAFQLFCENHQYKTSRHAIEALVRALPEYRTVNPTALVAHELNGIPDTQDNSATDYGVQAQRSDTAEFINPSAE